MAEGDIEQQAEEQAQSDVAAYLDRIAQQQESNRQLSAGLTREGYANQAGIAAGNRAAQLKTAKMQVDYQYAAMRQQARTAAERLAVDKWYNEQQVMLAREKLAEDQRQYNLGYGLKQGELGLGLMRTAAELGSQPGDWLKASAYGGYAAANPEVPAWLMAARTGQAQLGANPNAPSAQSLDALAQQISGTTGAFGGTAPAVGMPTATVGQGGETLTAPAPGQPGAPNPSNQPQAGASAYPQWMQAVWAGRPQLTPSQQAFMGAVGQQTAAGPLKESPGWWGSLTVPQQQQWLGAARGLGLDVASYRDVAERNRPWQGSPTMAA